MLTYIKIITNARFAVSEYDKEEGEHMVFVNVVEATTLEVHLAIFTISLLSRPRMTGSRR